MDYLTIHFELNFAHSRLLLVGPQLMLVGKVFNTRDVEHWSQ